MPVEIRELVIKAVVDSERDTERAPGEAPDADAERKSVVDACVREVMRIIRESKER